MSEFIKVKATSGSIIQTIIPNSFDQDMSIASEKVFEETDAEMVITRITIEGNLEGFSSPLVINVSGEDCTISVDFDEASNEIQKKMPIDKSKPHAELSKSNQLENRDLDAKEKKFVNGLRQKGLFIEVPLRLPDDEFRKNFKRIEVKGEPISETIIRERG